MAIEGKRGVCHGRYDRL